MSQKQNTRKAERSGSRKSADKKTLLLYLFVMLSFVIPILFLTYRMVTGTLQIGDGTPSEADYTLMLLECILGVVVIHIPMILSRRFRFEVPVFLQILYFVFLYGAIFLGEVCRFYYTVPNWDTFLHALSSVMTGVFGFICIAVFNKDEHIYFRLSPAFVALFAFCFSVMIGVLWEIYEFTADSVFGTNMQKFITGSGEVLAGRQALLDTMKDLIVDTIGAFIASLIGYFSVKKRANGRAEEKPLQNQTGAEE